MSFYQASWEVRLSNDRTNHTERREPHLDKPTKENKKGKSLSQLGNVLRDRVRLCSNCSLSLTVASFFPVSPPPHFIRICKQKSGEFSVRSKKIKMCKGNSVQLLFTLSLYYHPMLYHHLSMCPQFNRIQQKPNHIIF